MEWTIPFLPWYNINIPGSQHVQLIWDVSYWIASSRNSRGNLSGPHKSCGTTLCHFSSIMRWQTIIYNKLCSQKVWPVSSNHIKNMMFTLLSNHIITNWIFQMVNVSVNPHLNFPIYLLLPFDMSSACNEMM